MTLKLCTRLLGICLAWVCLGANAINIEYWKTSQGTPVYFVEAHDLPMLDVRVIFTAGSAYDEQQWGIASLTASALNEGVKSHNADEIAQILAQTGAQYSVDTNRDVTILSLRSLSDPKYLEPSLQIFNKIVTQPTFPESALLRLKQQTLAAIRQQQDDPFTVAMNTFYKNLYPKHPYGHDVLGEASTLSALTPSQLQAFYQRFLPAATPKLL